MEWMGRTPGKADTLMLLSICSVCSLVQKELFTTPAGDLDDSGKQKNATERIIKQRKTIYKYVSIVHTEALQSMHV